MQCNCGKMVLDRLYDERLYLSTTMLSRTKVVDISSFFFSVKCLSFSLPCGRAHKARVDSIVFQKS